MPSIEEIRSALPPHPRHLGVVERVEVQGAGHALGSELQLTGAAQQSLAVRPGRGHGLQLLDLPALRRAVGLFLAEADPPSGATDIYCGTTGRSNSTAAPCAAASPTGPRSTGPGTRWASTPDCWT